MTGWHAGDDLVARYTDGSLAEPDAWSLERHLEGCGPCAARASRAARAGAAGPVLARVRDAVLDTVTHPARAPLPASAPSLPVPATPAHAPVPAHTSASTPTPTPTPAPTRAPAPAPAPGIPPSAPGVPAAAPPAPGLVRASGGRPGRLGGFVRPGGFVRIGWAAGPALRGAWTGAVLLVALGALALAYGGGSGGARPLLLAVAPVVPVAGVALSYGRYADPLHEIVATSPSGGLRLLLTRTAAVLAVSVPLLTAAGLLLPAAGPRLPQSPAAAAWLLPGLALTLAALALSGFTNCRTGSAVVGGGWLLALTAPVLTAGGPGPAATGPGVTARLSQQLSLYFTGASTQWGWAAAAALCALLLTARRTAYDRLETM
ncbi:zf-HC2 domain-containing protein [Streptomyces sp. me109]|uniref:zf-HC2 domain-containing protein n=1 Tax=Streptomyces sp. me109 TaxID=1827853 RepID=UPI0011CDB748|nr:zf-HC2 domain-containing protein [Streptomyces sp. me109]TXS62382.1 zf-HC2 domain-containing protein [Streptomyces sp. me109]